MFTTHVLRYFTRFILSFTLSSPYNTPLISPHLASPLFSPPLLPSLPLTPLSPPGGTDSIHSRPGSGNNSGNNSGYESAGGTRGRSLRYVTSRHVTTRSTHPINPHLLPHTRTPPSLTLVHPFSFPSHPFSPSHPLSLMVYTS